LVGKRTASNQTQRFTAITPASVEAVVTVAAPLTAHTCPAGKNQRCFAIFIVTAWPGAPTRNLRARIQGVQIKQFDSVNHLINTEAAQLISPLFSLGPGDTVSVTTQNTGTEGGTMRVSVIILEETPAA